MKVAFEFATYNKLLPYGIVDRLIAWQTQSLYCHAELVFGRLVPTLTFSATKSQGVRFGRISDLNNPKHWALVDIPLTLQQEQEAYAFAKTMLGQKYNTLGILRFVFGPIHTPKHEAFCSQAILMVLQHVGLYKGVPSDRVDPGFLYDLVIA
jgi:hypothetical protein